MNEPKVGSRVFVVRGAVLSFAALALASCGADKLGGVSTAGVDAGPLELLASGGPAGTVTAAVSFYEPGVGEQETCTDPLVAGACQLTTCQGGPVGDPGPGYGNFGPMSATVGTTTMPITYDFNGYPTVGFPAAIALGTGGVMRFHGGDGVSLPTFDVSVTIPGVGVITSLLPAADGTAASVDTSQDLSVSWQPIPIGQIDFQLAWGVVTTTSTVLTTIACTFDGTSGSGVVPQTLLATLKEMATTGEVYGNLWSELDATTVVGGLTIVTKSFQSAATPATDFQVILQ
jgi:hypothetical protein